MWSVPETESLEIRYSQDSFAEWLSRRLGEKVGLRMSHREIVAAVHAVAGKVPENILTKVFRQGERMSLDATDKFGVYLGIPKAVMRRRAGIDSILVTDTLIGDGLTEEEVAVIERTVVSAIASWREQQVRGQ